jgi:hypothetical protein
MGRKDYDMMRAKILGRVERLLGSECAVNPFPVMSLKWEAFREGWVQAPDNPISRDFRINGMK